MASLSVQELTHIFLALALLLGVARAFGELARLVHQPSVLGEIIAGILLGSTVFGRLAPELQHSIFPTEGDVAVVLNGITQLAVTMFMLVAGMEVDLSKALRQGKATVHIAVWGMVLPFAMGWLVARVAPGLLMENSPSGAVFPLFVGTALSISALPVIAKVLKDLNLIKTDLGAVIVASATINDLLGGILFAVVIGMMGAVAGGHGVTQGLPVWAIVALTLAFTIAMMTVGRWAIHKVMPFMQAHTSWPGGVLGFALTCALLGAAFTEHIGIHAIFGAFIFGIAFGDTPHLRERTRSTLDQFISFIFAPLFFASIGLSVDFIGSFSLVPVLVVLVISCVGKVVGCYGAGLFCGLSKRESMAIGAGENARGAIEIIFGLLALNAGIIDDKLFVALVIMALLTSMTAGWSMEKVLNRSKSLCYVDFLSSRAFASEMQVQEPETAIAELAEVAASVAGLDGNVVRDKAWERESLMPTGLPGGIAIPHARLEGLPRPVIVMGRSTDGVDFDAPDGSLAHLIFLILTPESDPRAQLELISGIAKTFDNPDRVMELMHCRSFTEIIAGMRAAD